MDRGTIEYARATAGSLGGTVPQGEVSEGKVGWGWVAEGAAWGPAAAVSVMEEEAGEGVVAELKVASRRT